MRRVTGLFGLVLLLMGTLAAAPGDDLGERPPQETEATEGATEGVFGVQAVGQTTTRLDDDGVRVWRVEDGYDLDQYLFRASSPLHFAMQLAVHPDLGPFDPEGYPTEDSPLYDTLTRLTLRVYDVDDDQGEVDTLTINGQRLEGATLAGANNQWSINTFRVPGRMLRLGAPIPQARTNDFEVDIDVNNGGWAVQVDWAELRIGGAGLLPVMLNHGITGGVDSDGNQCADTSEEPWELFLEAFDRQQPHMTGEDARQGRWVTCPVASLNSSAEHNAGVLEDRLDEVLRATGQSQIDIVAHSMGGLNSRVLAHQSTSGIRSIQMLGTPHAGSPGADMLCTAKLWSDRILADMGRCWDSDDGLYQLRPRYVQDVFNDRYPDLAEIDYRVYGGYKGNLLSWTLRGQDDGTVSLSSVYWLRPEGTTVRFLGEQGPEHAGLHDPGPVVDNNHSELWSAGSDAIPHALCWLWTGECGAGTAALPAPATTAATTEAPTAQAVMLRHEGLSLAGGASISLPIDPEDSTTIALTVLADQPVSATFDGAGLTPGALFGEVVHVGEFPGAEGTLEISNESDAPADVVVVVEGDSAQRVQVVGERYTTAGRAYTIEVETSVPDGTAVTVTVDDGRGATVASQTQPTADGRVHVTFTPSRADVYEIVASTETPQRSGLGFVTATDPTASLGVATFSRRDTNRDGLFEQLVADVPVTVSTPAGVRVVGQLAGSDGALVLGGAAAADIAAGTSLVEVAFATDRLHDLGLDGPYELVRVLLIDDATGTVLAHRASAGATPAWSSAAWQHDRVTIHRDFTDAAIDDDGNGQYDRLVVSGSVTVDTATSYDVNARLVTQGGHQIAEFQTVASLPTGTSTITLTFPGLAIGELGIDGPFAVEDLSVYPRTATDALGYRVSAHMTGPYESADFEGGTRTTTFGSYRDAIVEARDLGAINPSGIATALLAKLDAAQDAHERGNQAAASGSLDALEYHLDRIHARHITDAARAELLRLHGRLIERL